MINALTYNIGKRYMGSRYKNRYISFVSFAALIGLTLGIMALITVLSVMNGFESELRNRLLGMISHIQIENPQAHVKDWQSIQQQLMQHKDELNIQGSAPYIEKQSMASYHGQINGVRLQGISPEQQKDVSTLHENIVEGRWDDLKSGSYTIAVGIDLYRKLGLSLGEQLTIVTPKLRVTPAGVVPRMKRFTLVAVYKMRMKDFDSATAFVHIDDAAMLMQMPNAVSGIRVQLDNALDAANVAAQLNKHEWLQAEQQGIKATDWSQLNKTFFATVHNEKIMMGFVLFLIVVVSAFNLVSSLVMVVNDKQSDIAIMRTMGMSQQGIKGIFYVQGSIIGLLGTVLGALLGVLLSLNVEFLVSLIEGIRGQKFFPENLFFINTIPSELHLKDVVFVVCVSLLMMFFSVLYPARRAAKTEPAKALRYE